MRRRVAAHSLTCDTLPGPLSTVSVCIVCMESMIIISGLTFCMWSVILSSDVSHSIITLSSLPSPWFPVLSRRRARIFSWCALSSPLTYNILYSGRLRIVCSVSVLLPMPGSPPSRMRLPGTSPPPRTLLSSLSLRSILG